MTIVQPEDHNLILPISIPTAPIRYDVGFTPTPGERKTPGSNEGCASLLSKVEWPKTLKEFFDPQDALMEIWHRIFVISCLISLISDPLFFYIPFINDPKDDTNRCIGMEYNAKITALVLRSVTDLAFVLHIIHESRVCINTVVSKIVPRVSGKPFWEWKMAEMLDLAKQIYKNPDMPTLLISIIIDAMAIIPIPHVAILVFFHKFGGSENLMYILNVFLLFQYLPKIYRIYLSCLKLNKPGLWAKGAFNLFLYILASHVVGAFWYFLSVQRETSCWYESCKNEKKNNRTTCANYIDKGNYSCDAGNKSVEYVNFLNEKCPEAKSSNSTDKFDFGIFLNALESGSTHSTSFSQKFFYSFWWGLRNLSSLGQNLETSMYDWENCFAILISLIGMLLGLYLIGNLQTYIQRATTKSEEVNEEMNDKDEEIQSWMNRNKIPEEMKNKIINNVKKKLGEHKDVHVENLLSFLPKDDRKFITRHMCMDTLKKVPMLQSMDERALHRICDHLIPVIYTENSYVIKAGEPLDLMVFNNEGTLLAYSGGSVDSSSSVTQCLNKGDYYGEELLTWASERKSYGDLPISTQNVKCRTKVEAFSLMAKDLKAVFSKSRVLFSEGSPESERKSAHRLPEVARRVLKSLHLLRALRLNRSRNHSRRVSDLQGNEESLELGYQPLYPVFPKSDATL